MILYTPIKSDKQRNLQESGRKGLSGMHDSPLPSSGAFVEAMLGTADADWESAMRQMGTTLISTDFVVWLSFQVSHVVS